MIKKNLKTLIITSVVILLPILLGVIMWDKLPEKIPMHWNAAGDVDGWASKPFGVFGMPFILLGFQWLCALVTGADPKKANHSEKVLHLVLWIIPVLQLVLFSITYITALGGDVPMDVVMSLFMGLLFVIIGNYLPKCQQNYTIGIKMSWTLNSEENWNRTHRFAGRLWVVCGLVIMVAGCFTFWAVFAATLPMVIAPVVYSYTLHRKGI